ncbi:cytochrome c oxidase subunit 7C, mitochondrial-like isoform X2 [Cricetulus griseus]|uniref:Cytochrome c oxidase subunit 7C, mitochondrial n=1 Tax=Cricetulus griseus TaxID=10029 RepID=A0A9J7H1W1_CRIGR|nr:cytochrome c oxidase subunit 7C, mitochondrial-like isoform X2 [Cricetulus griseus]
MCIWQHHIEPSIHRFNTSMVHHSYYKEDLEKNLQFSVENKRWSLAMRTMYFRSGFVMPFFIVRHQLLKK